MRQSQLIAMYSADSEELGVSQNMTFGRCANFLISCDTPTSQKIVRTVSNSRNGHGAYNISHARQDL
jgi:hypothetical protein